MRVLSRLRGDAPPPPQTARQYGRPAPPRGGRRGRPAPPPPAARQWRARPGPERQRRGRSDGVSPGPPGGCSAPRAKTNGPQPGDALRGLGEGFPRDEDAKGRREPESEAHSEGSGAARPPAACPRPASGNLKLPLVPGNSRRAFPAPPRWSCSQEEGGTLGAAPGCSWVLSIRIPG